MATRHSYTEPDRRFNGNTQQNQGMMGQVRQAGESVRSQAQEVVSDYPISTVLAVFGIGIGVGVLLGSSMFSPESSSSSSRWLPSGSSSSNWFPSMMGDSSWFPSNSSNWFSGDTSGWADSLAKGAKSMCGR